MSRASGGRTEFWMEVNLFGEPRFQDQVLLHVLKPYVERVRAKGTLVTWHYFREPEIRFRMRLTGSKAKAEETEAIASVADSLVERKLITRWHHGNHGEKGRVYAGEEDRYGRNGWKVAQDYFNRGAETALELLALREAGGLENPLWAKGLGNPWEGGKKNPWREREEDPLVYHWSRYVHLFTNQLGFDIDSEARLCSRQAARYHQVSKQLGMKW
jgi:hypothetical protein